MTLIAVGTPFDGDGDRPQRGARRRREADRRGAARQARVPRRGREEHRGARHDRRRGATALEQASGKKAGADFGVGMNPEFLSEGEAVSGFPVPRPHRARRHRRASTAALDAAVRSRSPSVPRLRTNTRTAEMIKYASNSLLATLISFSNELANLGASIGGIDTVEVMHGVHLTSTCTADAGGDRAADHLVPEAGCGFGGSCLPKDVSALVAQGKTLGRAMPLLGAVLQTNEDQPDEVVELLRKHWPTSRPTRRRPRTGFQAGDQRRS